MKPSILCTVLFCVASASFVLWRVHAASKQKTPQFEIVKDPSASHGNGCESLTGLAEHVLATNAATAGSTLTVLILGDQSTANEPWRMGTYRLPTVRKVLEGRSARVREQHEVLSDISGKCPPLRRTAISPIFLGVTQAVADLRARGCKASSHCELFVDSDLEENVEPSITKRLNKNGGRQRVSLPQVDNAGIDVFFCGVAVTDGRIHDVTAKGTRKFVTRDSDRVNLLQDVWRSLFEQAALVRFAPYCPNSTQLIRPAMPRASGNQAPEFDWGGH
jgi:hypothetical protein